MKMINEFSKDERISEQLLVVSVTKSSTISNSPYLSVDLRDKTGTINGKKWDYTPEDEEMFVAGNILLINGETTLYRDRLQLKITSASVLNPEEVDVAKFTKDSPIDYDTLKSELDKYIASISDKDLRKVVTTAIAKYETQFLNHPAGRQIHHDYPHGLLTHVISMCEIGEFLAKHYDDVDYDMLMSATILHDIGKCLELEGDIEYTYSLEGKLLGHISIGETIVREACLEVGLDSEKATLLQHCILSHHGQLEYGSPVLPLTKEALILSLIDLTDSRVAVLSKALETTKEGEYTSKIFALDNRQFYKPKK